MPQPRLPSRRHLRPLLTVPAAFLAVVLTMPTAGAAPVETPDVADASHTSVSLSDLTTAASSDPALTASLTLDEGVHVLGLKWEGPKPEAAQLRVREPGASWGQWADLDDAVAIEPFAVDATADTPVGDSTGAWEAPVEDDQTAPRGTLGDVVVGAAEVQVRLVGEASDASLEAWTTYRTAEEFQSRFVNRAQQGEDPLDAGGRHQVTSYLDHHARKLVDRFDANSYLRLVEAMNTHDVGRGRVGTEAALVGVRARTLAVGIDSDRLFPAAQAQQIARGVRNAVYRELHSPISHDGFLVPSSDLEGWIRTLLDG